MTPKAKDHLVHFTRQGLTMMIRNTTLEKITPPWTKASGRDKDYCYHIYSSTQVGLQLDTPDGPSKAFQRHTYQLPNNKHITVIHWYWRWESINCHTSLTIIQSTQPLLLYVHVHLTLRSGQKNARWTKPMWCTRKKLHKHPANQNLFLFASLTTCNSCEAFTTDVSITNASPVMNCTIYMN